MTKRTKLELIWPGKDERPRLEPRILIEDAAMSYHAATRRGSDDRFDNILIKGDNLLALKALEADYTGLIKCVYIDPPFNTQQAFQNYDDGLEHSVWLSLIRERLEIIRRLLSDDATLFIHIDDNELGYLIAVADEVFGRLNRIQVVTFKQGSATGHKSINPGLVSTSNFVLIYAKKKTHWLPNRVFTARAERDRRYSSFIKNRNQNVSSWSFTTLASAFAESKGLPERGIKQALPDYDQLLDEFVIENATAVMQLARPDYASVGAATREMIDRSKADPKNVFVQERAGISDIYLINGQRILFYADKLKLVDGVYVAGEPLTTIWDDILSNNIHQEGAVEFPKGKKPEALIKRCLELTTNPGDLILDSFAGSGTTGAVAHKMRRRWIMVEIGDHADTHIVPRVKKVIDGTDPGGVTAAAGWKGGGGFRYYRLAPSLLTEDPYGNWVIAKDYNPAMLAEALCKHLGFAYSPSADIWWQHGRSTETDFLYVTTQSLTADAVARLASDVGPGRSLLVACKAYEGRADAHDNLTLVKIPSAILKRCEWGRDDYSLNIAALPDAPTPERSDLFGGDGK